MAAEPTEDSRLTQAHIIKTQLPNPLPKPEDLLTHPQDDSLWREVLGREGAEWRLLAGEPDDPELN